jgi:ABC-2 type transport system permease protein
MRLLWAFILKDLRVLASYRLNSALMLVGGLMTLTLLFFLSETMGPSSLVHRAYGMSYFAFSLVGVALAAALRSFQTSFARRIRESQMDGSLEVLMLAPLPTFAVVALLAMTPLLQALVDAVGLLAAGQYIPFFNAQLHVAFGPFVVTLLAAALPFTALGLLSAAFVLVFKRGDPFTYALDVASYLVAGILYPREVLPGFLRTAAKLVPATYAVDGLRLAARGETNWSAYAPLLGALLGFAVVLWPLAGLALTLARRHVERVGTLPQA